MLGDISFLYILFCLVYLGVCSLWRSCGRDSIVRVTFENELKMEYKSLFFSKSPLSFSEKIHTELDCRPFEVLVLFLFVILNVALAEIVLW